MPTRAAALLGNPQRPTWSWDFARTGRLAPGATFTRASTGWYFNSAGVLVSAASNVPRFDHDPLTGQPLGYLAEMASTNGLVRSAAFENASWTKQRCVIAADQVATPDGNTAGDRLTEDNTTGPHIVYQGTAVAADSYVGVSCFFKAGTRDKFWINLQSASTH